MKLTAFLLLVFFMRASATGNAQTVTLFGDNMPLREVFHTIKQQTGYVFFYDGALVEKGHPVSVELNKAPLKEALDKIFANQPFNWLIENKTITLVKRPVIKAPSQQLIIQEITVSGMVKDESGKPLAGVSVTVKGSAVGTATDAQGKFSLEVPEENTVLNFSMVGFATQHIRINGRSQINVTMKIAVSEQQEIVVIGYGTTTRKDLTGAVSSIDGEELNKTPNTLFDASLTGRAPGVRVVKSSGAPGAVASIRIRGGTSAIGNNEPLYVIDGVPIEIGDGFGNSAYQTDYRNKIPPIANLNPADIESISILKDASSAAIYGSRAANGVVIITTKSGSRTGRPVVRFSYHTSFDKFSNQYEMLSADQYHSVVKTAYENAGDPLPSDYIAYPNANTDWVDVATQTSISQDVYLNVSGGTKDGSTLYSLSGSLTDQNGVIKFTDFERKNLRSSIETMLFGKVRFGTKLNYSATNNSGSGTGQFYVISSYRPDVPVYDENGNYGASPDSVLSNPLARISQMSEIENKGFMLQFFGELEIVDGLKLRSSIASNQNKGNNVRYTPSTDVFEIRNGRRGTRQDYIYSSNSIIFDNTLTYSDRFNEHTINLLAGASFTRVNSDYTSLTSINFQDDEVLNNLGSAGSIQEYSSGGGISGLTSYFLRGNYNFGSKYYITFTGRADHSTKFGPENRWGFFPSAAIAWNVANEEFMSDMEDVEELKLRVSYGKTGSANFSDFQYATFFGSGSFYNNHNGVTANTIPNPDIRWESTYQFDAAVDFSFFDRKLYGYIGYFQKITKDMILNREIIRETGGRNQFANMGDFLNKGWELRLSSELVKSKNFTYIIDLNFTKYKSKVLKLNGGSYLSLEEGEPIGYFTGYKVAGIFQDQGEIDKLDAAAPDGVYQSTRTSPGDFKFEDVNGDGYIGSEDNVVLGHAEPDFYGGWNNVFRYKNFELSAFFNYSVGNSLYNIAKRNLVFFTRNSDNYSTLILDSWTMDNRDATLPRIVRNDPNNNNRDSDFFIEDATYFKLKNLQISYLFDNEFFKKFYVSNIRAYATFSNVFTFTDYSGLDPEVNSAPSNNFSQGYDNNIYPQTQTITLGVDVKF